MMLSIISFSCLLVNRRTYNSEHIGQKGFQDACMCWIINWFVSGCFFASSCFWERMMCTTHYSKGTCKSASWGVQRSFVSKRQVASNVMSNICFTMMYTMDYLKPWYFIFTPIYIHFVESHDINICLRSVV
jgi:hypothetical protein